MRCDEVRDQMVEHLLGTQDEPADVQVRRHLRGCADCRRDMAALSDGLSTFARAAHELAPPEELKERVLSELQGDWAEETTPSGSGRRPIRWIARAVAVALVAGLASWALWSNERAARYEASALKYEALLESLGGENVRVANLRPQGSQQLEGSAVVYDSKVEQSWVLVLVRAPGMEGQATVTLSTRDGRTIKLHEMEFSDGGEASSWLVTSSNLRSFETVIVRDESGATIATGSVSGD
ncbi:MAG TPA: zf-HC2 domain-containing protein [Actinomycetota bacterium]|nr:zf-HC2 domain-containing protein [Actinomycetota bacterium]